jgi:hypothetical protein
MKYKKDNMDPYEALADAIILQAVRDYRSVLGSLKLRPENRMALYRKQEIENFFRSQWYQALTTIDGEMLIRKLNEEVNHK